jgi:hypothetical protein
LLLLGLRISTSPCIEYLNGALASNNMFGRFLSGLAPVLLNEGKGKATESALYNRRQRLVLVAFVMRHNLLLFTH